MNINELKAKCNELYGQAIKLFEKGGDKNEICRKLLDAATLLVEIGKVSPVDKGRSETSAQKVLEASKRLRTGESPNTVYQFLTGKSLVLKTNTKAQKVEKTTESEVKEAESIDKTFDSDELTVCKAGINHTSQNRKIKSDKTPAPQEYRFNWDSLPHVTFDDVAGLEDVKDAVNKKVLLPLMHPDLFDGYDKKSGGGLLLYGPPGTGKTMIAAAIAREIGAKFCSIGASDILMGGIGNSEKAIDALFKEARSFSCAVIFFDEIESICPATTHAQHAREIRSELLRQIQGLDAYNKVDDKILFLIAATNKPWDIDPAFVRPGRFGTRIYVGLPDDAARKQMIMTRMNKILLAGKVDVDKDIDYDGIVKRTEGFNGADVANLVDEVQEISIMRAAQGERKTLSQADFESAFENIKTSAQQKDLDKLEDWRKLNG